MKIANNNIMTLNGIGVLFFAERPETVLEKEKGSTLKVICPLEGGSYAVYGEQAREIRDDEFDACREQFSEASAKVYAVCCHKNGVEIITEDYKRVDVPLPLADGQEIIISDINTERNFWAWSREADETFLKHWVKKNNERNLTECLVFITETEVLKLENGYSYTEGLEQTYRRLVQHFREVIALIKN